MTGLEGPASPNRFANWASAGLVTLFAGCGVVQTGQRPAAAAVAFVVAVGAALFISSNRPAVLGLFVASAAGIAVLGHGISSNVGWFGICVLVGWCAFIRGVRATAFLWGAALVLYAGEWLWTVHDAGWVAWSAGTTFAAFGCLLARRERDLVHRLRVAQVGLADRTRAEERDRIARELHDVLAHSLTVSLLHVSSARLALDDDPAEARRAIAEAERLGRECLVEVRQVVGLLRPDQHGEAAPLPSAARLTALVAEFRGAGVDVSFTATGDSSALPATVGLALYRVLQEALTNAARHAAGSPVRSSLAVTATDAILVIDSGGPPGSGSGTGLLSMRERAATLGGRCTAGPARGGWQVRAELPLRPGLLT